MKSKLNLTGILSLLVIVFILDSLASDLSPAEDDGSVLVDRIKRGLYSGYYVNPSQYYYPQPAYSNYYYRPRYPSNAGGGGGGGYYNPDRYDGPLTTAASIIKYEPTQNAIAEIREKRKKKKLFVPNVWG